MSDPFPVVYDELRRLAAAHLAGERPGHTLDPTALVHEAYLKLVAGTGRQAGESPVRTRFYAAAAEAMRRILIDHARRRAAAKRGGGGGRADLDADLLAGPGGLSDPELLAVHEALDRLATVDPVAAELVKLRYFAGMTTAEAAAALGLALRTAERLWSFARAWLYRDLDGRAG